MHSIYVKLAITFNIALGTVFTPTLIEVVGNPEEERIVYHLHTSIRERVLQENTKEGNKSITGLQEAKRGWEGGKKGGWTQGIWRREEGKRIGRQSVEKLYYQTESSSQVML